MNYKGRYSGVNVIMLTIIVFYLLQFKVYAQSYDILIIYDEGQVNKSYYDALYTLENQLLSLNCNLTTVDKRIFREEMPNVYQNQDLTIVFEVTDTSFYEQLRAIKGKICWIGGSFKEFIGDREYIKLLSEPKQEGYYFWGNRIFYLKEYDLLQSSYSKLDEILKKAINKEVGKDLGVYLNIYDISVFGKYEKMKETADILYSYKIPFSMSVKPIYINENYSTVKEYMRALRYMQLKGGTAILSYFDEGRGYEGESGIVHDAEVTLNQKLVFDKMKKSLEVYTSNGIYPLAFELPKAYFDRTDYNTILPCFTTHLDNYWGNSTKAPREKMQIKASNTYIPNLFPQSRMNLKSLKENLESIEVGTKFKSVISFEEIQNADYLKEFIKIIFDKGYSIKDLRSMNNKVNMERLNIETTNGVLLFNNKIVDLDKEDALLSEEYNGQETNTSNNPIDVNARLSTINFLVVILGGVFIIVFSIIFIFAKRIDRRKHIR